MTQKQLLKTEACCDKAEFTLILMTTFNAHLYMKCPIHGNKFSPYTKFFSIKPSKTFKKLLPWYEPEGAALNKSFGTPLPLRGGRVVCRRRSCADKN